MLLSFITILYLSLFMGEIVYANTPKNQANTQNTSPVVQLQKPTLIVGSEQNFPPFSTGMTDETAGGFTVELWKAVATEAGLNYHIRVLPFHTLLQEFKEGKIDVLINFNIIDEAHVYADFSVPHAIFNGGIFVRNNESNINSEVDLNGKSIIMMKDDVEELYAASKEWAERLVLVNTAAEGMRLLASGKHDAMLINKVVGLQTLHMLELSNVKALTAGAGFTQKFAFSVPKGQTKLLAKINEAFAVIKANKVYDAIYEKWFGVYDVKVVSLFDVLEYLIPIILIFISIIAYNFYLRWSERKLSDSAKIALGERLKNIIEGTRTGTWEWNFQTGETLFNDRWASIIGYELSELEPISIETWIKFVHPDDLKLSEELLEKHFSGELPFYECEVRMRHKDGHWIWVLDRGKVTKWTPDGKPLQISGTHQDITERKNTEDALNIAATAFESQEGMMIMDADKVIIQVNKAFTTITGYDSEDAIGNNPSMLSSGGHDAILYEKMWKDVNTNDYWEGEIWNKRKNGDVYPEKLTISAVKDAVGIVTNYVGTIADITLRKKAEQKIEELAYYDPLTHLPNRRLMFDRIQHAMAVSGRTGKQGALLFIDLDHFKILNDTLGHDMGDLLLQQVAERLTRCIRDDDTVSRFGGDEFVLLLEGLSAQPIEAATQAEDIANKILSSINQPYQLASHSYTSTTSIGITMFDDNHVEREELLKQADIAMYQAKDDGRNALRFFDPQMQTNISKRAILERELKQAIAQQQFQLYYQIQISDSDHPLGAEVLIRWNHPERGLISPVDFIPVAEQNGTILAIGQWVLETACAQLKVWQDDLLTQDLTLSVNVSAKQFQQPDFTTQVMMAVQQHEINPEHLKLELTESLLLNEIEDTIAKMKILAEIGIQFSLDDFGTGYSSLQYLKRLPLYQLKIDKSFVDDLVTDSDDQAIVRTIIAMAHSLGLTVIAEGVETKEQQQQLLANGCTHFQGYLYSKPVPIAEFEALLKKG
jgi:diguanylate cyclase (GGDEF)-like protein/PAS domain S-box-containing protein